MSFISLEFVLLFLLCFTLYHFISDKRRKFVLLAASGVFIGYFNPAFLVTALVVSLFTYGAAILIEQAREKGRGFRLIYWGGIFCLVLCWIGFRYANRLTGDSGFIFPLGMSFYTFQAIGYLTEVYWEEEKAERRPIDFLLYMLLFMKFLSGPIERSADLLPQVRKLSPASYSMMTYGLKLIVVGLVKKLVLADHIAPYIDGVFSSMHTASGVQLLMACLLYPIELYADFSGYTDMAIGIGMLFGLKLSSNFAHPFAAQTTAEFWRRWHITLGRWFRDYVYIPLGGNRVSKSRHIFNLMVVWFLTGLWHGAAWNFVAWGLYYGIILIIEKYILSPVLDKLPSVVRHIYSIVLVVIGWVLFFSPSLGGAARYLGMMFGAGAHGVADRESLYLLTTNLVLWIILIIGSTPLTDVRYQHMLRQKKWNTTLLNGIVYAVLFILCIAYLVTETYNPFLYFRF